jgi:glycosyltransferase involved in cell wall biosynthesis
MLEEHKGILQLLKEYRHFSNEINLELMIVGDGSLRRKIDAFIEKHGLLDTVFPMWWVDRDLLYSLLSDTTSVVIPSGLRTNLSSLWRRCLLGPRS